MSIHDGPELVLAHGMEYTCEAQDSLKYPAHDQQYMQPHAVSPDPKSSYTITSSHCRKSNLPFSMPTWVFASLAVLLGALIGGSIVGGVLGSMLVNRPRHSDSSTANDPIVTSPTPASPAPASPTQVSLSPASPTGPAPQPEAPFANYMAPPRSAILNLSMPCSGPLSMHQQRFRSFNDRRFDLQCYINNFGLGTNGYIIADITAIMAYRWQDCFDACASHNKLQSGLPSHLVCRSAVYTVNVTLPAITLQGGNCFLKNSSRHANNPGEGNGLNVFSADLELMPSEEA
ncbi:hypothetical protein MCOR27_000168 [Pyricularia oryzae]|uniref:Apple domain-containing protein n=1 Tax=Pyricularia grisea TaxID=148305 RepID=A0ABQ8NEP0_PYRGI|nr:hypothetical protein MCOR01_006575 [Pyricularia oryzae]KAI6295830.1 hypothetical protein MCOR33_007374 [Pyricularia grisea]KAI6263145.1 hypothetical protein MCOR19_000632 [Pyricularia oryzae]KAI6284998.1 hypothetical protein MCOR26_001696 [Pyricularia oryzae]KAI6289421.1 hypothetical protein MCOR27_000168 [Pyricularia oryzae]